MKDSEEKIVKQDGNEHEKLQESMALLKMLALSNKSMAEGKTKTVDEAFRNIRNVRI